MNYWSVAFSGGSSTEALVAQAIGLIEAGYCNTVADIPLDERAIGTRMGGPGAGRPIPVATADGDNQFNMGWGLDHSGAAFRDVRDALPARYRCTTKAFAEVAVGASLACQPQSQGD